MCCEVNTITSLLYKLIISSNFIADKNHYRKRRVLLRDSVTEGIFHQKITLYIRHVLVCLFFCLSLNAHTHNIILAS